MRLKIAAALFMFLLLSSVWPADQARAYLVTVTNDTKYEAEVTLWRVELPDIKQDGVVRLGPGGKYTFDTSLFCPIGFTGFLYTDHGVFTLAQTDCWGEETDSFVWKMFCCFNSGWKVVRKHNQGSPEIQNGDFGFSK